MYAVLWHVACAHMDALKTAIAKEYAQLPVEVAIQDVVNFIVSRVYTVRQGYKERIQHAPSAVC